tara:strand:+ start:2001 stop:2360 length:360 start_codon:yes stop_codon:yes gene_type:complete
MTNELEEHLMQQEFERTSIDDVSPEEWDRVAKQDKPLKLDVVNNPPHYNFGSIECIEAIEESMSSVAFKGYLKGNAMKYLWRYDYKGKQVQDLNKAQWYLNKLTLMVSAENKNNGRSQS